MDTLLAYAEGLIIFPTKDEEVGMLSVTIIVIAIGDKVAIKMDVVTFNEQWLLTSTAGVSIGSVSEKLVDSSSSDLHSNGW